MRKSAVGLLILALCLLVGATVYASDGGEEIPTFDAFLDKLAGPLVAAAVGVILSFVVEYWPAFKQLQSRWKRIIFFGLCLTVPMLAALLRAALGYVPLTFDPLIWHAIWYGALAGSAGTLAHIRSLPSLS